MTVDRALIERLSDLAKLRLDAAEQDRAARQIEALLGHFDCLAEVSSGDAMSGDAPQPPCHRLREDVAGTPLPTDEVLANAPDRDGDCFRVPRVIEG